MHLLAYHVQVLRPTDIHARHEERQCDAACPGALTQKPAFGMRTYLTVVHLSADALYTQYT